MDITLTLAIATCQPAMLDRCLTTAAPHIAGHCDLVVLGNGCAVDPDMVPGPFRLIDADSVTENIGVPLALHRLWEMARKLYPSVPVEQHVVAYMHDDVFIHEDGWNIRLARAFTDSVDVVLAGFCGSPGLGMDRIYVDEYQYWQLQRAENWCNLTNAESYGPRVTDEREVVFVDGMAMALRSSFLDKIGGWSWWPETFVHHSYDYALSCMVRRHGGRCRLVPVGCQHGTEGGGGGTAGLPIFRRLADQHGGEEAIHRAGHRWVYDNFRDVLPLRLR